MVGNLEVRSRHILGKKLLCPVPGNNHVLTTHAFLKEKWTEYIDLRTVSKIWCSCYTELKLQVDMCGRGSGTYLARSAIVSIVIVSPVLYEQSLQEHWVTDVQYCLSLKYCSRNIVLLLCLVYLCKYCSRNSCVVFSDHLCLVPRLTWTYGSTLIRSKFNFFSSN